MFINGTFSDYNLSDKLNKTLNGTNPDGTPVCDVYCWNAGTHWSRIYAYGGFANLLMCINGVLIGLGGWHYKLRMIGMLMHYFLTAFLTICVYLTYKYRHSTMGQMAAISTMSVTNMTSLNITLYQMATYAVTNNT